MFERDEVEQVKGDKVMETFIVFVILTKSRLSFYLLSANSIHIKKSSIKTSEE